MPSRKNKPRELRRRVIMPARLRHGSSWTDACILNVSSRGLMVHSGRELSNGSEVELRRGDHIAIVAQVVWGDGGRAGLRAIRDIPVDDIMALGQSPLLRITTMKRAAGWPAFDNRSIGKALEFAGILVIAASLAAAGFSMVAVAFVAPLARASAAHGR